MAALATFFNSLPTVNACSHCLLPVSLNGQEREVNGERLPFCCYGCCLAYQVSHGERDEPEAAWLLIRIGAGAFLAMFIMLFSLLLYSGTFGENDGVIVRAVHFILWALATPLVVILGAPFLRGAAQAARAGRFSADTLVVIGSFAAYGYSALQVVQGGDAVYFDTATMVLVLFTLGRYLEAQARVRTARSLAPMLAAERASATVMVDGSETGRPVSEILPGAIVRVRAGERLPVDGVVIEGSSHCDEAVLTGQPERLRKQPGSSVYAGSINGDGALLVRASVAGNATRWVQISRAVRVALSRKSLLGELIDRVAAWFVPAVLLLALATLWYWNARGPFEDALMAGLAVLVVACPCALGLAAPLACALGLGEAAQKGILIRGGGVLEKLARVRAFAFDKTGTLTSGSLRVVEVMTVKAGEAELFGYAAGLAAGSKHPLSLSIEGAARERDYSALSLAGITAKPGQGMVAANAAMGSAALMQTHNWRIPDVLTARAESSNATLVYVGWNGAVRGLLCLADEAPSDAGAAVSALHELGFATTMLSGDAEAPAARIACAVGIKSHHAMLTPEGKVAALREFARQHGAVAMVGDGVNDGPVLAAAMVGIAVGNASDFAREAADITLPAASLRELPWLIALARRVRDTMYKNLAWAFGYNAIALSLAVSGLLQPVIAAGLMAGSSVVVVINSLRAGSENLRDDVVSASAAGARVKLQS
ncbi:MAG: cation-translocating P-type ATPase [Pseudomonadota bacterium]|nr:heavy metal translocating P-type ATPase [Burkholderiales bacterium]MDQ3195976.1 cation-translocating P-type ATPase [Pseudomonadota bacterium]